MRDQETYSGVTYSRVSFHGKESIIVYMGELDFGWVGVTRVKRKKSTTNGKKGSPVGKRSAGRPTGVVSKGGRKTPPPKKRSPAPPGRITPGYPGRDKFLKMVDSVLGDPKVLEGARSALKETLANKEFNVMGKFLLLCLKPDKYGSPDPPDPGDILSQLDRMDKLTSGMEREEEDGGI